MTRPRHTSGSRKGKFMSDAEIAKRKTVKGTYDTMEPLSAADIEAALTRIAPRVSDAGALWKQEGKSISFDRNPPPHLYHPKTNFPWFIATLDVAATVIFVVGVASFMLVSVIAFFVAFRYLLPEFLIWISTT